MAWHDKIRIAGSPGNVPANEVFQGVCSKASKSERNTLRYKLEAWPAQVAAWFGAIEEWVAAQRVNFANGDTVVTVCPVADLYLDMIFLVNNLYPSPEYFQAYQIKMLTESFCNGFCKQRAQEIVNGLSVGESGDVFTKLFKKFAFLKEGDSDQGYPDLVSLLLTLANQPIHIIISNSGMDCFLDTVLPDLDE